MYYSIIGIVAIIINIIINRDVLVHMKGTQESAVKRAYRHFNYGILAYHLTDVLWGICDASGSQILLYADTILYYVAMYVAVLLWAGYVVKYLDDMGVFGTVLMFTAGVLFVIEIVMLVVNHFVHFFFWVDAAGHYHAYAFRYVALVIQIIMFIVTSVYAFAGQKSAKDSSVRNRYRTIGAFGITMSVAIIIQMFYPLLPIYSIGYMIGACLIHSFVIEDENAELRRKADEANQAKTSFLFSMSHDIRTPMNAILGFTDIGLRHTDDKDTAKDCFEKIKTSGNHLLELINDILEMSRIESGHLVLEENPMDIRDAVAGVKQMGDSLALSKSIAFTVTVGNIKNPYIYADELHINEILINLISNAIKYTKDGGRVNYRIDQLGEAEEGKTSFRFEISDTGIGMSEEFKSHLFETFSREKSVEVSKIEGAGLGLSIVKKITDIAGGTISVDSKLGEGSTFTVEIPFRVMDEQAVADFLSRKDARTEVDQNEALKGKRVLLVEDNSMNREIAEDILCSAGFSVETAEDGKTAVERIREKGTKYFDFVLMDIQMPVMNGYDATRQIRLIPGSEHLPIIALSANAFAEDRLASLNAGMNDHIAKPIDTKELFEAMSKLL